MKTLHVQVFSGLGSRMRAVVAAIAAQQWKVFDRVVVHWPTLDPTESSGQFPARFTDLFRSPVTEARMGLWDLTWPKELKACDGGFRIRTCHPESILSAHWPLIGWPYQSSWIPSELVFDEIDSVPWPAGPPIVGVHIRHALAQPTTPPLPWFLSRMRELHDQYGCRFFLACDALQVEHEVRSQFPDVICQSKDYHYDRRGIIRAAADLFLLQRCDWMIGSYNSSFSELAGWMRGGKYLPGWGRPGWMPGGRYEDSRTPAVEKELQLALRDTGTSP